MKRSTRVYLVCASAWPIMTGSAMVGGVSFSGSVIPGFLYMVLSLAGVFLGTWKSQRTVICKRDDNSPEYCRTEIFVKGYPSVCDEGANLPEAMSKLVFKNQAFFGITCKDA